MTTPGAQDLLDMMKRAGIKITRENYIDCAYGVDIPDPWTPEHEAELPEELQNWSQFKSVRGKMVKK
jgi:hypothetical protein